MFEQRLAKKLGFNFQYTRYPRDGEPALSPSLGIPGFEEAPLQADARFPETLNTVDKHGYWEKAPAGLKSEYHSLLDLELLRRREERVVHSLREAVNASFDDWEEERSSEVVYRTDGLEKFLHRVGLPESSSSTPEQARFFDQLGCEANAFAAVVDAVDVVPTKTWLTQRNHKMNQLLAVILDHSLTATRGGWWMRLAYCKQLQRTKANGAATSLGASHGASTLGGSTLGGSSIGGSIGGGLGAGLGGGLSASSLGSIGSIGSIGSTGMGMGMGSVGGNGGAAEFTAEDCTQLSKRWAFALADVLSKTLMKIAEPKERRLQGIQSIQDFALASAADAQPGVVKAISAKQLAGKVRINEARFKTFEFICVLASAHFERGLVHRDTFASFLVTRLMRHMHQDRFSLERKGPFPLCVCYLAVTKIMRYAPFMQQEMLRELWRLCSLNMKMLFWTQAGDALDNDVCSDPAFAPYMALLQDALAFIVAVTPPDVFRSWELAEAGAGSGASAAPPASAPPSPSPSHVAAGTAAAAAAAAATAAAAVWSASSDVADADADADDDDDDDDDGDDADAFPVDRCTAQGASESAGTRRARAGPHGRCNRVRVDLGELRRRKRSCKRKRLDDPSLDAWVKFELLSNTDSLHFLLRNAKKVKRNPTFSSSFAS